MDEYIKREAVIDLITRRYENPEICTQEINSIPAADVALVAHGRWDDSGRYTFPGGGTAVRCTECGCALTVSEYRLNNWYYCPICGAKMDGGDNDAAD